MGDIAVENLCTCSVHQIWVIFSATDLEAFTGIYLATTQNCQKCVSIQTYIIKETSGYCMK